MEKTHTQMAIQSQDDEYKIHATARYPIHRSIGEILPLLEQRQEAAKCYQYSNNEEVKKQYTEVIRFINAKISEQLNFI